MTCQLIVYACPNGALAAQIETYFAKSQLLYGPNSAHSYMPHCSLTGFFHNEERAISNYVHSLDRAYHKVIAKGESPTLIVEELEFQPGWHGLTLRDRHLQALIRDFIQHAPIPAEPIRSKGWLHLSLAYDFAPEQSAPLRQLAKQLVDPTASVTWDLRFYQRSQDNQWMCYQTWNL